METIYTAPDIECAGCAASIERALGREQGIRAVRVAVPSKEITVEFDDAAISRDRIVQTLTDIGYPPED